MNSLLIVILLGFVQGITEFLPISSSGHLALLQHFFSFNIHPVAFDVVVHLGTLTAVLVYFKRDIINDLSSSFPSTIKPIFAALLPTALIGFLFKDAVERAFFSMKVVGLSFLLTSLILFITKYTKRKKEFPSISDGFLVGIFQGLSLLPGVSRSGATISAALYLGIDREIAAKFSFYIFIPAVLGASILELPDVPLHVLVSPTFLAGFLTSFLVGLVSLKFLIDVVKKGKLYLFSLYCLILGVIVLTIYYV